ncbi:hypothetical protein MPTK1_8g06410 [Marchantia polymorpha subsp. ruderalis]|uniref:Uncharacterized protein n=1 Tax=Marchantia polymorpha TaxID=3197 RepID=A0A2R6XIK5_MARPO|nr:hypothetical protein MARPO_0013s0149 [Marchantia polymorpha]BBN18897.1 hypothetical protein Mp_8g06410 [Marchantia polymorpha subsp. ruderalis]|eukprot:PTQ45947.1 hypothetical protein MARPO_0013s0149 [Marchantia polymorpha]
MDGPQAQDFGPWLIPLPKRWWESTAAFKVAHYQNSSNFINNYNFIANFAFPNSDLRTFPTLIQLLTATLSDRLFF